METIIWQAIHLPIGSCTTFILKTVVDSEIWTDRDMVHLQWRGNDFLYFVAILSSETLQVWEVTRSMGITRGAHRHSGSPKHEDGELWKAIIFQSWNSFISSYSVLVQIRCNCHWVLVSKQLSHKFSSAYLPTKLYNFSAICLSDYAATC